MNLLFSMHNLQPACGVCDVGDVGDVGEVVHDHCLDTHQLSGSFIIIPRPLDLRHGYPPPS